MARLIYVLHERSTKEHFTALEGYASTKNLEINYREFLVLRHLVKSILRLDISLFIQQIRNFIFFITIIFSKRKNIIIGIAPLDFYLPFLIFFLKKHNLFYFIKRNLVTQNLLKRHGLIFLKTILKVFFVSQILQQKVFKKILI